MEIGLLPERERTRRQYEASIAALLATVHPKDSHSAVVPLHQPRLYQRDINASHMLPDEYRFARG